MSSGVVRPGQRGTWRSRSLHAEDQNPARTRKDVAILRHSPAQNPMGYDTGYTALERLDSCPP